MPKKNSSKIYTAKNGTKYIKLQSGKVRFVKGPKGGPKKKRK